MQSLSLGKFRVLTKHPKVKEVEATDTFTFDKDFKAPLVRLKINNIQLKETPEENSATTEVSERERERERACTHACTRTHAHAHAHTDMHSNPDASLACFLYSACSRTGSTKWTRRSCAS